MKHSMIDEYKSQIRQDFLLPLTENQALRNRLYREDTRAREDGEFQRDYTRILYSSSFRRLQGKMQLLVVKSDQFIRNRLTHSLEVAQIARSIADSIGYRHEESYILEACSLAHDIGNPPFGHAGERFLNEKCRDIGGFEGNAQTFRILSTVEQKRADFQGLNLTYRTLLGILKYHNRFENFEDSDKFGKQKFLYNHDFDFVETLVKESGVALRTLDVQIVDLADEIAYAAHDLEDGLRLGIFTTDEILHDFYSLDSTAAEKLDKIFFDSKEKAGFKQVGVDSSEFTKLYRKEVTSRIINTLIHDIGIVALTEKEQQKKGTREKTEIGFVNYSGLASGLKRTVYDCITHNDKVYAYEKVGLRKLDFLVDFYNDHVEYLPPEYRASNIIRQYSDHYMAEAQNEDLRSKLQKRLVVDYVAGMMDSYADTTYERLKSQSLG